MNNPYITPEGGKGSKIELCEFRIETGVEQTLRIVDGKGRWKEIGSRMFYNLGSSGDIEISKMYVDSPLGMDIKIDMSDRDGYFDISVKPDMYTPSYFTATYSPGGKIEYFELEFDSPTRSEQFQYEEG